MQVSKLGMVCIFFCFTSSGYLIGELIRADEREKVYTETRTFDQPQWSQVGEWEQLIEEDEKSMRLFFDALREVETGFSNNPLDGDGGRSIGPYQISRAYWEDATVDFWERGVYQDCRSAKYAETVIEAYMARWCPDALISHDFETMARTHNGGPRGPQKSSTYHYWNKVNAVMNASKPN